ncbi:MAG: hypothetical protein JO317_03550, partial [Verrucomicrobiae bacterium]|nr:hypothetical protein [Verrucomicrobiae bacterium]
MNFRTLSLALGLALLGAPVSTFAVHSERVDQNSFEDFSAGEVHGVEVTQDGFLRAGPRLEKWVSFQDAAIWDAIPDGKGGYFVAAGNEGKVYRVDAQGKTSVAFQAKESNVFALALDAKGNLYAGSSPDGRVYRMGGDGKAEAWFEPNQKYIWDLAWRDGKLYVGTGENGILYRVSDKAKGEVFFDSDQKHIRTLFFDSKGRLWTGSDPDGVVFRFEKPESSAVQRVIYKSAFKEVKSFTEDARGNVFVATMGEDKDHPKAATATVKAPAPASPDLAATDEKS